MADVHSPPAGGGSSESDQVDSGPAPAVEPDAKAAKAEQRRARREQKRAEKASRKTEATSKDAAGGGTERDTEDTVPWYKKEISFGKKKK